MTAPWSNHLLRVISALGLVSLVILTGCTGGSGGGASGSAGSPTVEVDPVTITNYQGDFRVASDGQLTATETLTASFPAGRHGIFRFFDTLTKADPNARLAPGVTSVTMDGAPVPVSYTWESQDRYLVAKIGDPATLVPPGSHVYAISYTIPQAIFATSAGEGTYLSSQGANSSPPQSVFYWNVVAPGWRMVIQKAQSTISLPAASGLVQCTAGAANSLGKGPCRISGAGTTRIVVSAAGIPPTSGMTVRAAMAVPVPGAVPDPQGSGS